VVMLYSPGFLYLPADSAGLPGLSEFCDLAGCGLAMSLVACFTMKWLVHRADQRKNGPEGRQPGRAGRQYNGTQRQLGAVVVSTTLFPQRRLRSRDHYPAA
jgi:hypothetical protein